MYILIQITLLNMQLKKELKLKTFLPKVICFLNYYYFKMKIIKQISIGAICYIELLRLCFYYLIPAVRSINAFLPYKYKSFATQPLFQSGKKEYLN
jgi:hypothetical protein